MINKLLFASVATVSLMASISANAGVLGIADINISSLALIDVTNTMMPTPLTAQQIQISSELRRGTVGSDFNGVQGVNPSGLTPASITTVTPGQNVDVLYRCAGPGCSVVGSTSAPFENDPSTHIKTATQNFALGDMFVAGSALGASPGNAARGLTRADSSVLSASNTGGSSALISNSASAVTNFKVGQTINALFALTYNEFLKVFIDPTNPSYETSSATADNTFTLTVKSVGTASDATFDSSFIALEFKPTDLNQFRFISKSSQNFESEQTATINSEARTLRAGKEYQLAIFQASNSGASEVPEPGSIALMGLGLLAVGVTVARRRKA